MFDISHRDQDPGLLALQTAGATLPGQGRRPELVAKVVAHEPPMVEVLPDVAIWGAFFDGVYETYRREGVARAMQKFAAGVGLDERSDPAGAELPPDVIGTARCIPSRPPSVIRGHH